MSPLRWPGLLVVFSLAFVPAQVGAGAAERPRADHEFTVAAPADMGLGMPVVVKIIYTNRAEKAPWNLQAPEVSKAVSVSFRRLALGHDQLGATTSPAPDPPDTFIVGVNGLGDVGVHDAEGVGSALNPAKTISIPPGGSHTIQTDLTAHGLGLLNPGRYEVWAEDENESLNAQPVVFSVRFTSESVDALAKIAGDVTADGFRRQWCAHWLSTIDPDFHLHLPAPGDSADARANKNAGNERAVRSFRAFWAKAKGLKQTKRKLEEVNREAGVPDAEGAATKP